MDAGVPIQAPVAGISVGLVTAENISDFFPVVKPSLAPRARLEKNSATVTASKTVDVSSQQSSKPYVLLTDIIGTEDHYGDMDFKVAGTAKGVTAVQLDVKLQDGVPAPILEEALDRAREGRLKILESIATAIPRARSTVKDSAPRAEVVKFDPERKAHLVGRGGEMIRFIEEEYDCEVDTTEEGVAYIFGKDELNVKDARMLVQDLVAVVKEGGKISFSV
jgi:polyribonucleotide nucleotidyltransferase